MLRTIYTYNYVVDVWLSCVNVRYLHMSLFFVVFSLCAGTDPYFPDGLNSSNSHLPDDRVITKKLMNQNLDLYIRCLLYTSDAADE